MSYISKIKITNYKGFKDFSVELNEGLNILVGDNEAGKSTILEAIHLALTGMLNGKYLRNELTSYFFNNEAEQEYLNSLANKTPLAPPKITIEVFLSDDGLDIFKGDLNSKKDKTAIGFSFHIEFDDTYKAEYEELIKTPDLVKTIPIEYYKTTLITFAREVITTRSIPLKSVVIDSTSSRSQNGSDVYISKIIRDDLDSKETVALAQSYRKLKETFMGDEAIVQLNRKISTNADLSEKAVEISVDLSAKNSWDNALMTYVADIPFHQIGKGEQCLIKTHLALAQKKSQNSSLVLIEEPENHLSHTKLNQLIKTIQEKCEGKQILITTHSSFVANKLNLSHLTLLNDRTAIKLRDLTPETQDFFEKLAGFETLRVVLAKKAILVEGPSDELIVQKAFYQKHGCLPIEQGIDVISVGLSFKRFLEIAQLINKPVAVVTDNDGDFEKNITKKYTEFSSCTSIKICADSDNQRNTLEPQFAHVNAFEKLKAILGRKDKTKDDLIQWMVNNKTTWALSVFSSTDIVVMPQYINDAVDWISDEK
jgi:putative ATP-dependent endonuclease of OLD family